MRSCWIALHSSIRAAEMPTRASSRRFAAAAFVAGPPHRGNAHTSRHRGVGHHRNLYNGPSHATPLAIVAYRPPASDDDVQFCIVGRCRLPHANCPRRIRKRRD